MHAGLPSHPEPGVVDHLIEERAGKLFSGPMGGLFRRWLHKRLNYDEAVQLADRLGPLPGFEVLEQASAQLAMRVEATGTGNIPREGGFLLVANHPTGIADGVAVFDLLRDVRPDLSIFCNVDALRVAPKLTDVIIPVDWLKSRRTVAKSRFTFQATAKACREGRAIVLFPSGRLSHMTWRGLRERTWLPTAVSLARKYGLPIVPMHIRARNSLMYYLFALISDELRDVTVFHELLNKRGKRIHLEIGRAIRGDELALDPVEASAQLRAHVQSGLGGLPPLEALPSPADENDRALPSAA